MAKSSKAQNPACVASSPEGNGLRRSLMDMLVITRAFAIIFVVPVHGSGVVADDEQSALRADRSLGEALAKADKAAAGAFLDEGFEWTNAEGKTRSKAESLQDFNAFAKAYGDEASIKTYDYGQIERIAGTHYNLNFVRLWVKRPAGWRAFIILEAPLPTKLLHPTPPTAADKDCENPCKILPYTPTTPAQQAAMNAWLKTKVDEWQAIPDDWKTHVGESMVIFSPTMSLDKAGRLALLVKQKEAYGTGSPSPPVVSMRMFDFGNAVVMTAHHGPGAAGLPSYAVRVFANEDGDWKIVLSTQTDVKQATSANH